MDLELLQELVAFKKYGTLSKTAEHLMITQPSVTRGMQKLEQELGVKLFTRTVNRISLNKTGELAAKQAQKLLDEENNFIETVINFDKMQQTINIGFTAPGPLLWLESHQAEFKTKFTFNHQFINDDNIINDLTSYKERVIFSTQEIQNNEIESLYIGPEKLSLHIDPANPLSSKKYVTFNDLKGISFLVATDIGPWRKLIEDNIPGAKFLFQKDLATLDELTHYSKFPTFRSNVTLDSDVKERNNDNRITIPIKDKNNVLNFYANYLVSERKNVTPLLKKMIYSWPKVEN